ncbi:hypothetical protein M2262_003518 [Pseudomonas sp. BIGb0408]|uniref:Uncharacterized protein n=1 Tax=Phytopseudomonas flavescens TaxID=29435 RepID=A0A7Z0BPB7_9GAMM|nr:hypothetical protein [Pseudomonas sp. BIGb0408]NYH71961.1 hypothetical protein [Pseudomonas flavescens]
MRRELSNKTHRSYRLARKRGEAVGSPSGSSYVSHTNRSPLVSFPGASHFIEDLHEDRRK